MEILCFPNSIRRTTIQGWYDEWIGEVKDLLRDHRSTRRLLPYALAILSGWGTKRGIPLERDDEISSSRVQHKDTAYRDGSTAMLERRSDSTRFAERRPLPDPCHWYIAQSESHNSKRHLDARRCARLRQKSAYVDGEIQVHDLLIRLMSYAQPKGFQPRRPLLQRFAIQVGPLGRLHLLCFWSEQGRAEHSPACDPMVFANKVCAVTP